MDGEARWSEEDDTSVHVASLGEGHPTFTAIRFLAALGQLPDSAKYLGSKITPESREWWGDFGRAAAFVASLDQPGIISLVRGSPDALDVAWVLVVENVAQGHWHHGTPADDAAAGYLTMVNRPSLGGWHVHHLGKEVEMSLVPRDSPATAS